jgi:DMSO/TMAO reductase YedYZ molybdopterin-dependent catalytic subunit
MHRDRPDRNCEPRLHVEGLVARPVDTGHAELAALPHSTHEVSFTCEEGWTVPRVRWRGVRLADVIALANPLPSARYVRVHAGHYTVPISLDDAALALVCDQMDGRALTPAHGAPWRLMVPGRECFTSVKWVDRLELTAQAGERTGELIARGRLR